MVWGGISLESRTELVIVERGSLNADRYSDEILARHVLGVIPDFEGNFIFMDDNARPHRANRVNEFLESHGITRMEWPARSPDLNPIEHVWATLKDCVKARLPAPETLGQLKQALQEEWQQISQEYIQNLILSMPRRLETVTHKRGGNTPY